MPSTNLVCLFFLLGTAVTRPGSQVQTNGSDAQGIFIMNESQIKRGSCKTRPIVQTVQVKGCLPLKILNNYCYGQCNSVYIPQPVSDQPLFDMCAGCRPARVYWKRVTLRCPDSPVKFKKHKYLHAKRCRCTTVRLR